MGSKSIELDLGNNQFLPAARKRCSKRVCQPNPVLQHHLGIEACARMVYENCTLRPYRLAKWAMHIHCPNYCNHDQQIPAEKAMMNVIKIDYGTVRKPDEQLSSPRTKYMGSSRLLSHQ